MLQVSEMQNDIYLPGGPAVLRSINGAPTAEDVLKASLEQ